MGSSSSAVIGARALKWARRLLRALAMVWMGGLLWTLSQTPLQADRAIILMVMGGGGLFLLVRIVRAWERAAVRGARERASRALATDPGLSLKSSREALLPCLLGMDSERTIAAGPQRRVEEFLDRILPLVGRRCADKRIWLGAVKIPLWAMELIRSHWASTDVSGSVPQRHFRWLLSSFPDEELLGFALGSVVTATALFRLHVILWGMPRGNWGRRDFSRLRRAWLAFCNLEPTQRHFPPSLPRGMKRALDQDPVLDAEAVSTLWLRWLQNGDPDALDGLERSLLALLSDPEEPPQEPRP